MPDPKIVTRYTCPEADCYWTFDVRHDFGTTVKGFVATQVERQLANHLVREHMLISVSDVTEGAPLR